MFIYLDKESAKQGIALVLGVYNARKKNFKEYFVGNAIEFEGDNIPHYITYIKQTNTIREATEEEKLSRNQRELANNEVLIDGKIVIYDISTQKIVNNEIIDKIREDYINEKVITIDTEKNKARVEREKQFKALDLYDKAVLRGDIQETEIDKKDRDTFRKVWLDLPNNYTDLSTTIEELYPIEIESIKYFII